ncbi:VOC family protein [Clostridium cellulovorans]|uniref:Glyoxalase/bleomycin resistance protein/dioxygenase n=1 Tax=Clostridium cellulovorans (strain ATCC 35296 / DSM 3052 / OCM 3 / 743B) TaxID=573061 RepID=D9SQF4_CLOC7|nr:VOC family protein [Clostridium cellulovorans]ADL50221.1 Glyoxalase/bleomycin resistance protein/dioxygenase [Clostridium cellulovorans 743B]
MVVFPISHVAISCKNPIQVEKFYTKYFGFKRARVYSTGPDQVVMIKSGNTYLELFKSTKELPVPKSEGSGQDYPGWKHICFLVDDLEVKLNEMGEDAKISLGPTDMSAFIPNMKVCWIEDPEGNIVELNQGYVDEENPPG